MRMAGNAARVSAPRRPGNGPADTDSDRLACSTIDEQTISKQTIGHQTICRETISHETIGQQTVGRRIIRLRPLLAPDDRLADCLAS